MTDCTLANTSSRNRAIGLSGRFSQALCVVTNDLIPAMQSHHMCKRKDGTAGLVETAAGHADAAGGESVNYGGWRIGPLCNESKFTIDHDHDQVEDNRSWPDTIEEVLS